MKVRLFFISLLAISGLIAQAQTPVSSVPLSVRSELTRRYPDAKNPKWDKNNGNYEAKWVSKADGPSTAAFTQFGAFVGVTTPTPVKFLPAQITDYVKNHYQSSVTGAQKNVSAVGKITYRIKTSAGKTVIFDQDGKCLSR
ncbi:PepSY-like domain-containing protein [Mucilaginibacter sp. AW1-3]